MEDRGGFFFRVGKDDTLMHEILAHFQQQGRGKLSRAIRDGLRLFWDLSHQRTDVLIELFPFVTDAICPKNTDSEDMERRIAEAVAKAVKAEIRQQRPTQSSEIPDVRDYGIPAMKQSKGKLGAHSIAMPLLDDDDDTDTIVLTKATGSTGKEALASLFKVAF